MKRALALAAVLAATATMSGPAFAAGTPQYGSVQLQWNVATTLVAHIVTNYTAGGTSMVNGANTTVYAGGACPVSNVAAGFQINFGALTPSTSLETQCTAKNAIGVSALSNDSAGITVNQYLDAAAPAGIDFCAFPNGGGTFGASLTASGGSGAGYAAYSGSCAAGGKHMAAGTGGTLTNAGAGGGDVGGTGEYYSAPTGGALAVLTAAAALGTTSYATEDLQINAAANQASSATTDLVMTIQVVPN